MFRSAKITAWPIVPVALPLGVADPCTPLHFSVLPVADVGPAAVVDAPVGHRSTMPL